MEATGFAGSRASTGAAAQKTAASKATIRSDIPATSPMKPSYRAGRSYVTQPKPYRKSKTRNDLRASELHGGSLSRS
ncbi:hypothetical protein GCM10007885_04220 [Methylobacterium gnaphalii]|nr:hypothetical protein GCM10007885_04220 [Methylobacterium gnaphalii]